MLEMVYEDLERQGESMTFERMIEFMLNGRGSNTATVRDIKELLRMVQSAIQRSSADTSKRLQEELSVVTSTLHAWREEEESSDSDSADGPSDRNIGRAPSTSKSGVSTLGRFQKTVKLATSRASLSPAEVVQGW
eukprot:Skav208292  [mRNA]  locus=scaffold897:78254:80778:+ [translate_table: standard]